MSSFAKANELYKQGKYQEALEEYLKLQDIYGGQILSFNIQQCRKKLERSQKFDVASNKSIDINANQKDFVYSPLNTSKYRQIFAKKYEGSGRKDVISLVELAELDLIDDRLSDCLHKIKVAISLNKDYRKIYEIGDQAAKKHGDMILFNEYQSMKDSLPITEKKLTQIVLSNQNDSAVFLTQLAEQDIIEGRFKEALEKAQQSILVDKEYRKAYYIAEQAAIELGDFETANKMYLEQPPVINPTTPRLRGVNSALAKNFVVPPLLTQGNNYNFILEKASLVTKYTKKVSLIITVYNRSQILANTLAALTHQTYPKDLIEVMVIDDGSSDDVMSIVKKYENVLNIYAIRQKDDGYRLAAARNLGLKCATGEAIIFMDADILPCPTDIESYMKVLHITDQAVLIGHRRYVDVSDINDDLICKDIDCALNLPNIIPDNQEVKTQDAQGNSFDWRFEAYSKSNSLRDDLWPFTKASGGNIAFSKSLLEKAGLVDEDFKAWGCEDGEHGYRLYNAGAFFIPMKDIVCLHQEPLTASKSITTKESNFRTKGSKITRRIFSSKCPAPTVRKYETGVSFEVPKVSIYIPAYNASKYIIQAIESCLNQNFADLEVCICNDGSTDNTLELLEKNYANNPKVRWITQPNKGIGAATNQAIRMCRGMYIAQLDSDDVLKPTAVRSCVEVLDKETTVDAVYTDCDYIDKSGKYIRDGWCGGEFDRSWMATQMIATHFRMFRKRIWSRIEPCNEQIKNAVDLDLWLKINELSNIKHIHKVEYSYRWHGENTSIQNRKQQESNHIRVVRDSLIRQNLDKYWMIQSTHNPLNPREFRIIPKDRHQLKTVSPKDVVFLIPTCKKYANKTQAVRETWASQLSKYGFRYLFLIGEPTLEYSQVIGDVLYVPCRDDYESLLLKLALGYRFIYQHFECDYVYKIDDDTYPNLDILVEKLLPQLLGCQFAGGAVHKKGNSMNNKWHYGKCSSSIFDKPYKYDIAPFDFAKGGYGYFIRRDALPVVFNNIGIFREELESGIYSYEDVRISELMLEKDIIPYVLLDYTVARIQDRNEKTYLVFDISNVVDFKGCK